MTDTTPQAMANLPDLPESCSFTAAKPGAPIVDLFSAEQMREYAAAALRAQVAQAVPLAANHISTRVDYSGLLGQVRRALGRTEGAYAEMIRQFQDHIKEMGSRFYAGELSAVDEFLQLYCVECEARALLASAPPAPLQAEPTRDDLLLMLKLAKEASADLRRAGRAEAAAIIMGTDPEDGLDRCIGTSRSGPDGDSSSHWLPAELTELLDCGADNPMTSLLDRLEGAYWDALGRQHDAEFKLKQAAQPIEQSEPAKCELNCADECKAKVHGCASECPALPNQPPFNQEDAATKAQPAPLAQGDAPHVGDSRFEGWFSEYNPKGKGTKQMMRDAYAKGMDDPVAVAHHRASLPTSGVPVACKTCDGSRVVHDGELNGVGGVSFSEGSIRCAKDCPDCAAPQQALVPLSRQRVKDMLAENGYDDAQARADFINGLRQGELAHGITSQEGGAA